MEWKRKMTDIVERLREDKLDALAAVESENAFYQMEIERLRDEVHFDDQTIKSLSEINDRLQKKIERLREVLGQIIIDCDWPDRVMKHARQALKEGE